MNEVDDVTIATAAPGEPADGEMAALLARVYVDGGFTLPDTAKVAFAPAAVRARGEVVVARTSSGELVGMVIVVSPHSAAKRIAEPDEAEMHLLAVLPEQRGRGLGARLVEAAVTAAKHAGFARMVLWTQPTMHAAHRLYEARGFARAKERDARISELAGRSFLVFQRAL